VFIFRALEKSILALNCEIRDCVRLEELVTKLKSPLWFYWWDANSTLPNYPSTCFHIFNILENISSISKRKD